MPYIMHEIILLVIQNLVRDGGVGIFLNIRGIEMRQVLFIAPGYSLVPRAYVLIGTHSAGANEWRSLE
jgi:hypothetical protein